MAKNKTLELSIKIAGKMDKSLTAALASSQGQLGSFAKSISNIGTAGLAAGCADGGNGGNHRKMHQGSCKV